MRRQKAHKKNATGTNKNAGSCHNLRRFSLALNFYWSILLTYSFGLFPLTHFCCRVFINQLFVFWFLLWEVFADKRRPIWVFIPGPAICLDLLGILIMILIARNSRFDEFLLPRLLDTAAKAMV